VPSSVTVSLAITCGGAVSASTQASSVKTLVGSARVIQFLLPAALSQNTYFVSISGIDSNVVGFASTNCSQVALTTITTVTGCREINVPGSYSLGGSFAGAVFTTSPACLAVHDTTNVQLDCRLNTISGVNWPAISVTNVQSFSIRNCTLTTAGVEVLRVNN